MHVEEVALSVQCTHLPKTNTIMGYIFNISLNTSNCGR